jgi:hypothetical protein
MNGTITALGTSNNTNNLNNHNSSTVDLPKISQVKYDDDDGENNRRNSNNRSKFNKYDLATYLNLNQSKPLNKSRLSKLNSNNSLRNENTTLNSLVREELGYDVLENHGDYFQVELNDLVNQKKSTNYYDTTNYRLSFLNNHRYNNNNNNKHSQLSNYSSHKAINSDLGYYQDNLMKTNASLMSKRNLSFNHTSIDFYNNNNANTKRLIFNNSKSSDRGETTNTNQTQLDNIFSYNNNDNNKSRLSKRSESNASSNNQNQNNHLPKQQQQQQQQQDKTYLEYLNFVGNAATAPKYLSETVKLKQLPKQFKERNFNRVKRFEPIINFRNKNNNDINEEQESPRDDYMNTNTKIDSKFRNHNNNLSKIHVISKFFLLCLKSTNFLSKSFN